MREKAHETFEADIAAGQLRETDKRESGALCTFTFGRNRLTLSLKLVEKVVGLAGQF